MEQFYVLKEVLRLLFRLTVLPDLHKRYVLALQPSSKVLDPQTEDEEGNCQLQMNKEVFEGLAA